MVVHNRDDMIDIAKIAARQPSPAARGSGSSPIPSPLPTKWCRRWSRSAYYATRSQSCWERMPAHPPSHGPHERRWLIPVTTRGLRRGQRIRRGTGDVILGLEQVAAEAAKPLVGVFLDFHPPLDSSAEPDSPETLPRFDGSVDAIQALAALTADAQWCAKILGPCRC